MPSADAAPEGEEPSVVTSAGCDVEMGDGGGDGAGKIV
jgi:hypothetical protein